MRTTLIFAVSLCLFACGQKKEGDGKTADAPKNAAPDSMGARAAKAPEAPDARRPADVTPPHRPAPAAAWVEAADVKPEQEKVECHSSGCTIYVVTQKVKAELEKRENYAQLEITFHKSVGNAFFNTVSNLPWIRKLSLSSTEVDSLAPVARLTHLEELSARSLSWPNDKDRKQHLDLAPLKGLRHLKKLNFYGTRVKGEDALSESTALKDISFYMSEVTTIGFVKNLIELENLDLYACPVTDLAPLASLTKLKQLNLYMNKSEDFSVLAKLPALELVWLQFTTFSDLNLLANAKKMKTLYLSWLKGKLTDLTPLGGMPDLETLNIKDVPVENLEPLTACKALQTLDVSGTKVKDLKALKDLTALSSLDVRRTAVSDLAPLAGLQKLRYLSLGTTQVRDLRALKGMTALYSLDLSETAVSDLSPLSKLPELGSLDIHKSKVRSLAPLMKLSKLRYLTVDKTFPPAALKGLKKAIPGLDVRTR